MTVPGLDQAADADAAQAHATGERRADHSVAEPRLRRRDARLVRLERRLDLVELRLRQRLRGVELAAAVVLAAALLQRRLGNGEVRPRLLTVEFDQQVAPPHFLAFGKVHRDVTRFDTLDAMSTDSFACAVPSASSSTTSLSMRAGATMTPTGRWLAALPAPAACRRPCLPAPRPAAAGGAPGMAASGSCFARSLRMCQTNPTSNAPTTAPSSTFLRESGIGWDAPLRRNQLQKWAGLSHRFACRTRTDAGRPARPASRFGIGALGDALEQRRRQIALAGVGQHGEDHRALRRLLGDLERRGERGAGRDAAEDAFLARERARGVDGLVVGDRDDLVGTVRFSTAGTKSGVQPWILCGLNSAPASSGAPSGSVSDDLARPGAPA